MAFRVVFMGTPEFALPTFRALTDDPRFEVVAAYTQPDRPVGRGLELRESPVKAFAKARGIAVHQPEKLTLPGEFEKLAALAPDFIVVVAYGQILKRAVLDLPRFGCVNVHASLLPRWRGAAPLQWAILAGDARSGIATMRMAEKLDAGDVLLEASVELSARETASTIHDRLSALGGELIVPTLLKLEEAKRTGASFGTRQDESLVTYASKLTKDMEPLAVSTESAAALDRRVRALNPWPGTSVRVKLGAAESTRLKIKDARLVRAVLSEEARSARLIEKAGMVLLAPATGSDALELVRVQWDGKKETDVGTFLNGLRGRGITLPLEVE